MVARVTHFLERADIITTLNIERRLVRATHSLERSEVKT